METKKLEQFLDNVLSDYSERIRSIFPEGSSDPVNSSDLCEIGRQTFYALDSFKKEIIDFLKDA